MSMTDADQVSLARLRKNAPAIITDLLLGVAFFIVAKLTDLTIAAYFGVAAGVVLVIAQRFIKSVDLLGGLALFGIFMLGVSAVFASVFQDENIIKLRSTFLGGFSGVLFLCDGLLARGRFLGARLLRYMPADGIDPRRLAIALGAITFVVAGVNLVLALYAPEDVWLLYTTFGDVILAAILFVGLGRYIGITPAPAGK